jgi:hypothetical protein
MLAEIIKKILSGLAIDFVEGESQKREIYLHEEDVNIDGISTPLSSNRVIKVTFEYADAPKEIKE